MCTSQETKGSNLTSNRRQMMSVRKRYFQNCPRAGNFPQRARAELVLKRLRAWMELMRELYAECGPPKFSLLIPVSKMASADKNTARLPQPLLGCLLVSWHRAGRACQLRCLGAQRNCWQSDGSLVESPGIPRRKQNEPLTGGLDCQAQLQWALYLLYMTILKNSLP